MKKAPTFIDVFAGCGGLSFGLMAAGWNGIFAVERDQNAFESLKENLIDKDSSRSFSWPSWLSKDPHAVDELLGNYRGDLIGLRNQVDLLAGGPPCQGFSAAGRREASDPRNKLTASYLDFVSLIQPKLVLIENVKGITVDFIDKKSKTGTINYAQKIISALSDEYNVHTRLIDTSQFGVPQKRKRFFILGIRKDISAFMEKNPFDVIDELRLEFLKNKGICVPISAKAAISDLETERNGVRDSSECHGFKEISYCGPLTAFQRLMNAGMGEGITDTRLARHNPVIRERFEQLIERCHADGRLNISISSELRASYGLKKCAIRVLDPDSPSPTITSMPDDLIHYKEPRTLTVRENARLQSFPDSFVFKGKYTTGGERRKREVPRFTQVANAVPPLVAEAIGRALIK
ncbi:DNA cytosine methyltransferase [Pseudacidovorax intermedius]|uniref:DNA cytosine methyltransferase n=1 Tax=Pseudacidovorax intermedius TaxID=433924 RepID=UPI0009E91F9A|nr:DNA cytosine methyltransferase [Pseudacidovorax intermedius]